MPTKFITAHAALARLREYLPATTVAVMQQRLMQWEAHHQQASVPVPSQPELVMRPGLPPRPLNKHYFTVVRTYE